MFENNDSGSGKSWGKNQGILLLTSALALTKLRRILACKSKESLLGGGPRKKKIKKKKLKQARYH